MITTSTRYCMRTLRDRDTLLGRSMTQRKALLTQCGRSSLKADQYWLIEVLGMLKEKGKKKERVAHSMLIRSDALEAVIAMYRAHKRKKKR